MVKFAIGQGVHRVEDNRLLTGAGRYTDDIEVDGAARSAILRSPVAHAVIRSCSIWCGRCWRSSSSVTIQSPDEYRIPATVALCCP